MFFFSFGKIWLLKDARLPKKATEQSAGYDVFSYEERLITPGKRAAISLGFKCAIPPGYYGQLKPRSGLAWRNELSVDAGVIDSDYRGVVKYLLVNYSEKDFFSCEKGMRIGELIIKKLKIVILLLLVNLKKLKED